MHQVIRQAIEHRRPIQIHTGLQEGNANVITNSHPAHLVNLFLQYPQARFDIFHASYPLPQRAGGAGQELRQRLRRHVLGVHHLP